MRRSIWALALFLASMTGALAQSGRACVAPQALQVQPIVVIPEAGFFSYRVTVFNAGGVRRNFSYHFPLPMNQPPPGAVYGYDIRPQQTVIINLGSTQERASEQLLRSTLRITCHS